MIPVHDVEAVACNKFYIVGKMVFTCLIQGGKSPVCIADGIADYLVYDEVRSKPCLEDTPGCAVRHKMKKVCRARWLINCYMHGENNKWCVCVCARVGGSLELCLCM